MITYFFADGTRSQVTAPKEVEELARDLTRLEENLERKERYHNVALEAMEYEGLDFASPEPNAEDLLVSRDEEEARHALAEKALSVLSEKQRRRVVMRYMEGLTLEEIAKREGVSVSSLHESLTGAMRKMKERLKDKS